MGVHERRRNAGDRRSLIGLHFTNLTNLIGGSTAASPFPIESFDSFFRFHMFIVYFLMVIAGLVAAYTLLTAGSESSLLRNVFPAPQTDLYIAVISSFIVFILGFIVFFSRDQRGFRELVEVNADKIRALRQEGKSEEEIVDSILAALGSGKGYKHNMARKKLLLYLSEFK